MNEKTTSKSIALDDLTEPGRSELAREHAINREQRGERA
jgi:hypothetical protein